jgi:signal transduction histidine kinase
MGEFMRNAASIRIVCYLAVLAVTASLFVAAGVYTWNKRNFWEKELRQVQADSVQFGQECRAGLRELNISLLRYWIDHDPVERTRFNAAADELWRRFGKLDRDAFVPESRNILSELLDEFARYRKRAESLFDVALSTMPADLLTQIDAVSERILALDVRLSAIQRENMDTFVTRARRDLDHLWMGLYAGMAVLLLSGIALARVAYRDLIGPLRLAVVQSRALLEQKEKLAALGLLTAGLAHEIRNPLNSIKARLFTQRRVLGESTAGLEDNRIIEEEVDRLEALVRGALQFARPAPPTFQRLRLQGALKPWCGLMESSLRQAGIELKSDFRADPEVEADANQLKQAVLNLVNNAAESIGKNGTITLRTVPAALSVGNGKQSAVAVEVEDTGGGIAAHVRKRLFDPFFTTKENGTGLGLSIAARIAHAHGGAMEFASVPGHGALFRIVLPAAESI